MPPIVEAPGWDIAAIIVAALLGSLLSALTTALAEIPDERLMAIRDDGGRDGATADRLLRDRSLVRSRLLAGRVLSVAAVSAFSAHLAVATGVRDAWILGGVFISALAYAILAEIAQTIARGRAGQITLPLMRAMRPLELLLAPFAFPISLVSRLTDRLIQPPEQTVPTHIAEREVEHVIQKREEEGAITEQYAELLLRVLGLKDTMAREIMVPRTRMTAIAIDMAIDEVVAKVVEEGHSRYPVYRERADKIEGILHAKDLFQAVREAAKSATKPTLAKLVRKNVLFVAETQKIGLLLREMQARRQHLAIVVDEFGGTSGVVTLEDILEEIVGEINDEHDTPESLVTEVEPGRYIADARVSLAELGELVGQPLEEQADGAYDSLGGLVIDLAGRVPEAGDVVRFEGLDLIVKEADQKRVQQVEIRKRHTMRPPPSLAPEAEPPPS